MTTGARITIDGETLAATWDGSDLVAATDIRIRWGRDGAYDDPEPSILTLTLVDRRGVFTTDADRIGQEVTVEMTDPARRMFRGTITVPKARRRTVWNPLLDDNEVVWVVTITASDALASLGMAVFAGDATDGMVEGAGGWGEIGPTLRIARLYDAGAGQIVEGIEPVVKPIVTPPVSRSMHGQAAADARTALELIQQIYRTEPLGVVNYDPESEMVTVGRFAKSSPFALVWDGDVIVLDPGIGYSVPASRVGVTDYTLESSVAAAIDVVQLSYWWYGKDPAMTEGEQKRTIYTQGFIEAHTDRFDPRTRRVLRIDTEHIVLDPTEFAYDVSDLARFPGWLLARLVEIVNVLNGQPRVPDLIFDARRMPLPADIEAFLYRPVAQAVPVYFAGSVLNAVPGVSRQFQIIGGTLTYDGGWRHEATVCATGPAIPSTLTLADLSADPEPTVGDLDPDLTIADLGLVTIGLPT